MEIEQKYIYKHKHTQDEKHTWSNILDKKSEHCFKYRCLKISKYF
jgi:hypothetical protein